MSNIEIVFEAAGVEYNVGNEKGVCRFLGKEAVGLNFSKWVRDTFTDLGYLKSGTIVSNEALFTFDEASEIVRGKSGKEKPQRFRTYSHIVTQNNEWLCVTKADKELIYNEILKSPKVLCLTDTGQKHIFFKGRFGFWQLDELFIVPDVEAFRQIHSDCMTLIEHGFSQGEIKSGTYNQKKILEIGLKKYLELEGKISEKRGTPMFILATWLLFYTDK
jgi:hypothetical protein